jgi:lauroyl/myristoyl acyltransferase
MMMADWFTYYGYSLGWSTVRKMSDKQAYGLFDKFAERAWKRGGKSIQQYEKNIHRVLPDSTAKERSELARYCMHSYATYWCDAFRMPDWSQERIANLPVTGVEHLERSMADFDVSPIIVVPHAGNYDAGAAFLAARYGSLTTIAERLKPEKLFDKFVKFRASNGVEVLAAGDPSAMKILKDRIHEQKLVGIVGERDLSRRGITVDFFGSPARMPAGPAALARRTGAPLHTASFWYEGRQPHAAISEPLAVDRSDDTETAMQSTTRSWADSLAEGIALHPGDWHMLQPLWVADLDPARDPRRHRADPK